MDAPSLRDRATTGVAWSALHVWGTHAAQLGIMLVLARLLDPRAFGLFAMVQVVLVLLQGLVAQGLPDALIQADEGDDRVAWSTGMLAVLAGGATGTGALILMAPLVVAMFGDPALEPLVVWMAPAALLHGVHAIFYARARDRLMFAEHARAGIASAIASFAVGVPVALAGYGVWALVVSAYAAQVVETTLLIRATGRIPLAGFDWASYRRLLRFGRHIVAGSMTTFLNRRADDYFVGLFLGPSALGVYAVAYRVLELVTTVFLRAVERVAFPVFAKLRGSPELMVDGIRTSFRFTSLVAFPAFAGLALVAPDLVLAALGASWAGVIDPLRILALGGIALCAVNVLPSAIRAMGYPQWNVAISAVHGVLVAGGFALTARWSVEAVSWVFTVGVLLAFPVFFVAVRRLVPVPIRGYLAEAAGPLGATAVMVTALLLLLPVLEPVGALVRLPAAVATGALVYTGAILVIGRSHVDELIDRLAALRGSDRP